MCLDSLAEHFPPVCLKNELKSDYFYNFIIAYLELIGLVTLKLTYDLGVGVRGQGSALWTQLADFLGHIPGFHAAISTH